MAIWVVLGTLIGTHFLLVAPPELLQLLLAAMIVVFLTQVVLAFLLRGAGGAAVDTAFVLANVVVSPLLFIGGALLYRVTDSGALGLQTSYAITDNDAKIGSNDSLVFRVSYTQTFVLPPGWGIGPLVVTPLVYRIYSWDTVPNPIFDPVLKSSTKEWRYGITAQLGLSDNIAANLHVVHEDTFANLPNTRIRNTQAVLGVLLSY